MRCKTRFRGGVSEGIGAEGENAKNITGKIQNNLTPSLNDSALLLIRIYDTILSTPTCIL
jgi:hypothetical protein